MRPSGGKGGRGGNCKLLSSRKPDGDDVHVHDHDHDDHHENDANYDDDERAREVIVSCRLKEGSLEETGDHDDYDDFDNCEEEDADYDDDEGAK